MGRERTGLEVQSEIVNKQEHDALLLEMLAGFAKLSNGQGSTLVSSPKLPLEGGDDKDNHSCPLTY